MKRQSEMPTGGVDVRLSGRELDFVVAAVPPAAAPPGPPGAAGAPVSPGVDDTDDGNLARITLRLPEAVKARAEDHAARSGSSLNTWLVNVVRAATRQGAINVDIDLSSLPQMFGNNFPFGNGGGPGQRGNGPKRMNGWV